jgi:hypothetical protein
VYAYPYSGLTEYINNQYKESLQAVTTRIVATTNPSKQWRLSVGPGVEVQFLRQNITYLQSYTIPFSLSQVVPDPYTGSFRFVRPDLDVKSSYLISSHVSFFVGYRFIASPDKDLSRLSAGLTAVW